MNRSSKFNFFLPQNTDPIDVSDFNSNFETIDANLLTKAQNLSSDQKAAVRANVDLNVANNLTTTAAGSVLDARQGKALNDKIDEIQDTKITFAEISNVSIADNAETIVDISSHRPAGYVLYFVGVLVQLNQSYFQLPWFDNSSNRALFVIRVANTWFSLRNNGTDWGTVKLYLTLIWGR